LQAYTRRNSAIINGKHDKRRMKKQRKNAFHFNNNHFRKREQSVHCMVKEKAHTRSTNKDISPWQRRENNVM
jgi:hypothetical protein